MAKLLMAAASLTALALCQVSCAKGEPRCMAQPRFEADPVLEPSSAMKTDRFALSVFRTLAGEREGNIVFSPASVESVLLLLREGAAGSTRRALDALPLGQQGVKSAMDVQSANALFVAEDLSLKKHPAAVLRVPFATQRERAVQEINRWCDRQTHGLVPQVVTTEDIPATTRLIACNAVYLKERWLRPFDAADTVEQGRFLGPEGREQRVPLMGMESKLRYAEGDDWQAVALFYRRDGRTGEPACFIGILPKGAARDFAGKLSAEKFDAIRRALASAHPQQTIVTLPKMDADSGSYSLKGALAHEGLQELFGPEADFSAFADEPLCLSDVMQRCHVIVSEKETEAAAVTMGIVREAAFLAPESPREIHFTRPFIWAIGDLSSGAPPYFIGLCESPGSNR